MYKTLRKVVLLFLLTLAVVCGAVFVAACDTPVDENGGGNEDAKVTYSVTVTVDSGVEGVTLTSLKAQWKSGSTTAGEKTLDADGKASVELDAGNYTVELDGVPDTATYAKASVTATSHDAAITITAKSGGDDLEKLSVPTGLDIDEDGVLTWNAVTNASGYIVYDGNNVLAGDIASTVTSYDLTTANLTDGEHSISVAAKGDGVTYSNSDKSTAVPYTVEGEPQEVNYTVYLPQTLPSGVGPTDLTLVATDADGEVARVAFSTSYSAYFSAIPAVYCLSVEGLPSGHTAGYLYTDSLETEYNITIYKLASGGSAYWSQDRNGDWDSSNTEDPYVINALGTYYVPIRFVTGFDPQVYVDVIQFTAPEDGEHSYTFSWDTDLYTLTYMNSVVFYDDDCLLNSDESGSLIFSLEQGDEVTVLLRHSYEEWSKNAKVGYAFTITAGGPIPEGHIAKPFELDPAEGEHTAPEGLTEAYFSFPWGMESYSYAVTFESGVSVYFMEYGKNSAPVKLESGDYITTMMFGSSYLYATATAGTQIKFTITEAVIPGSNPEVAIDIDEVASAGVVTYDVGWETWFKFTPKTAGDYRFYNINNVGSFEVYGGYTVEQGWNGDEYVGTDKVSPEADNIFSAILYLEANKPYYVKVGREEEGESQFKIATYEGTAGDMGVPLVATNGENSVNISTYDENSYIFFKYVATQNGILKFTSGANDEYTEFKFFSDRLFAVPYGYSVLFDEYGYYGGNTYTRSYLESGYSHWKPNGRNVEVKTDDVIYFYIMKGAADTVGFTIAYDTAVQGGTGTLSTEAAAQNVALGNTLATAAVLTLSNVNADVYTVSVEASSGELILLQVGDTLYRLVYRSGKYTALISIPAGVNSIKLYTGNSVAVTANVSLSVAALPSISTAAGAQVTLNSSNSSTTLKLSGISAGTYHLSVTDGNEEAWAQAYVQFILTVGDKTYYLGTGSDWTTGITEIDIEIPEGCMYITLSAEIYESSYTLTLTLTASN